jgi:mono/diheme cytochrome c family protein
VTNTARLVLAAASTLAIALAAALNAQTPQDARGAATGNPVNGKKLYEAYTCYGCHGFGGETGARRLVDNPTRNLASEASFIAFLRARANVAPAQPSTSMPNYSAATLSDAQARDIYAYIRTFKSTGPPVDQIAPFTQILSGAQKPYRP